ncbi:MAG: L-2-amino-thiazoline-4-carboxylic acid hydrolase [Oscillospiraceae bacterium]|nr:L-2-amino-thiazoline-4-carboxylic acid hydrolase [Oscillospiraceae bacterium]
MRKEKDYKKLAKKFIRQKPMPSALKKEFQKQGLDEALENVYNRTAELLEDNENQPDGVKMHLKQILPSIAFYEALLKTEGDKERALQRFGACCFVKIEKMAKIIPVVMRIPGLHKKTPAIMNKMLDSMFGSNNGFRYERVDIANGFAANMLVCPYVETCKKYNCPELAQFFCKSDDICYGNMHPKLIWGRTQTLGCGGDCCDFSLYLKDEEK